MANLSLAERFQAVTEVKKNDEFLSKSFDEMAQMTIAFGEAKVGQTYLEVIETDPKYVQMFTKKYAESTKSSHKSFLFFIQMYVERKELTQEHSRPRDVPAPKGMALKPKSRAMPPMMSETASQGSWSEDLDWEPEMPVMNPLSVEVGQQNQRISAIEDSLAMISQQLQALLQVASLNAPVKP